MSKTCLMIVAGERSGDVYGARLATALKQRLPEIELFGCGGEAMRHAGVETTVDARQFAMVGITEVISGLPRAYRAFHELLDETDRRRPKLAVLIDSPSLNLRLAKQLKRRRITVAYFVSPQIWAWKRWRLGQLKTRIDKMLCIFDFEEGIYQRAGIPVEYVGHPLVDTVEASLTREVFFAQAGLDPDTPTVALLPGSREIEVSLILPTMLKAAAQLARARPVQFVIAAAATIDPAWLESTFLKRDPTRATLRKMANEAVRQAIINPVRLARHRVKTSAGVPDALGDALPSLDAAWWQPGLERHTVSGAAVCTITHSTYDALRHSDVAVVASGTATVEAALLERPMVVVYRVAPLTGFLARFMVSVPHYSMVNLLAGKAVVPELIQSDFTAEKVAAQVGHLLDHAEARETMKAELRTLKSHLGSVGAIERAADAVVRMLEPSRASVSAAQVVGEAWPP